MKRDEREEWERAYARNLLTGPDPDEEDSAKITEEQVDALVANPEFKLLVFAAGFYNEPGNYAAYKKWLHAKKKMEEIRCVQVNSKAST